MSWSIYTHYRQSFSIDYKDMIKNVLLLYVEDIKLKDMLESHMGINIKIVCIGVLTSPSTFYDYMMNFKKLSNCFILLLSSLMHISILL